MWCVSCRRLLQGRRHHAASADDDAPVGHNHDASADDDAPVGHDTWEPPEDDALLGAPEPEGSTGAQPADGEGQAEMQDPAAGAAVKQKAVAAEPSTVAAEPPAVATLRQGEVSCDMSGLGCLLQSCMVSLWAACTV